MAAQGAALSAAAAGAQVAKALVVVTDVMATGTIAAALSSILLVIFIGVFSERFGFMTQRSKLRPRCRATLSLTTTQTPPRGDQRLAGMCDRNPTGQRIFLLIAALQHKGFDGRNLVVDIDGHFGRGFQGAVLKNAGGGMGPLPNQDRFIATPDKLLYLRAEQA